MDTRTLSDEYTQIGQDLIDKEPELSYIRESEVVILFLSSPHKKTNAGRLVYAQCEKVPDKYRWAVPCDFTITVFNGAVVEFTEEQKRILMFHELLHVGVRSDDTKENYYVRPHNLEDFKLIIDRYGVDWDNTDEHKGEKS